MIFYVLAMGKKHLGPHVVVGYGIKIFWPGLFITTPDHLAKDVPAHCYRASLVRTLFMTSSARTESKLYVKPRPNDCNIQRNISQHCWAQHVARVWPPCCDMLQHVGCCWLKFEAGQI